MVRAAFKLVVTLCFICGFAGVLQGAAAQDIYVRGGVSSFGWGRDSALDSGDVVSRYSRLETFIEAAVGISWVVSNSIYVGIDGQLANLGVFAYSNSGTSVYYTPNVQARLGFSAGKMTPYIAGGWGYTTLLGTSVDTNNETGNFTYSFRVGSHVNVTEKLFLDIFGQFVRKFRGKNSATDLNEGSFGWSIGCALGMHF